MVKELSGMPRFVLHEHHARNLHFDLRLEMRGVLKSWAIPKGPSLSVKDRRLAIMVEDHPLEYLTFEAIIPPGQYGSGPVIVWDTGPYELMSGGLKEGHLDIVFHGKKLRGMFVMVRLKGKDREWLFFKKKDRYAVPSYKIKPDLSKAKLRTLKEKEPPCRSG